MSRDADLRTALRAMAERFASAGAALEIPPRYAAALGMTVEDFGDDFLVAEFPVDPAFANPRGVYLGGMLCALVDAVCGPLSYIACGRPAVTTDFSMTFLRPLTARDAKVSVRAEVVARSRTIVVMEASARSARGKLVARARATGFVLDRRAPAET